MGSTRAEATVVVAALSADLDQTRGWYWNWSRGYACAICKSLWMRACEVVMGLGLGVGLLCGGREDKQRLHLNLPSIALSCEF